MKHILSTLLRGGARKRNAHSFIGRLGASLSETIAYVILAGILGAAGAWGITNVATSGNNSAGSSNAATANQLLTNLANAGASFASGTTTSWNSTTNTLTYSTGAQSTTSSIFSVLTGTGISLNGSSYAFNGSTTPASYTVAAAPYGSNAAFPTVQFSSGDSP
jgi:predicted PurR-regulated permease PerM